MPEIPSIHFVIEKEEVLAGDNSRTLDFFKMLTESEVAARIQFQNIIISFNGYDDDVREVFEIDPIRDFVQKLDLEFPYWLYFLDPCSPSFYAIAMCFLPPSLTDEGKAKHHPPRLKDLLLRRWIPALYDIGQRTGMTESELDLIALRWGDYFFKGPQKPPIVN